MSELLREQLENRARQAFLEIEKIVSSHREANVVPTFGASDIFASASELVSAVMALDSRGWLEDAPELEPSKK